MLARASLGKESVKSAATISPKPSHANEQFSTEPPLPEHEFTAPKFPWSIGKVAVTAPSDGDGTGAGDDGRPASARTGFTPLPWPIQAKLEVGAVDDPLEREADRVAEQVMRMPEPAKSVGSTMWHARLAGTPGVPTQSESVALRRTCSCGGSCDKCKAEQADDEHGRVQRKPAVPDISNLGASPVSSGKTAPPIVHEVLHSPGEPLPPATLAFLEPKLAHDLSTIRVHADDRAAESAHAIHARAYTVGHNIVFGAKQYQPGTVDGRRLLAHELTHSIQQSAGSGMGGKAGSGAIRSSSRTRVMCAPPTPASQQRTAHPSVMPDIEAKFGQLYSKLSPQVRYRLYRNITIAIGVVTEESDKEANSPLWVYTLAGNASSKEIDAAAEELGLTRWKPSPRTQGRGAVGAPNDAEQLLTEGAEANHLDVWAVGVNRKVCGDCQLHLKDAEVPVQAFPDGAFRKGGSLSQYQPPSAVGDDAADPPGGVAGGPGKPATPGGTTAGPTQPKLRAEPSHPPEPVLTKKPSIKAADQHPPRKPPDRRRRQADLPKWRSRSARGSHLWASHGLLPTSRLKSIKRLPKGRSMPSWTWRRRESMRIPTKP